MVFGQPVEQLQNDLVVVQLRLKINLQSEIKGHLFDYGFEDQSATLLVTMGIPIEVNRTSYNSDYLAHKNRLPKHLNTFSLAGLYSYEDGSILPQKRLNSLLAMNDPEFPKENSLIQGLNPVRYQTYRFGGAEDMPQGFGPRIRI